MCPRTELRFNHLFCPQPSHLERNSAKKKDLQGRFIPRGTVMKKKGSIRVKRNTSTHGLLNSSKQASFDFFSLIDTKTGLFPRAIDFPIPRSRIQILYSSYLVTV